MHVREGLPDQPTRVGRIDWPKEGDNGTHLRLRSGHVVVFDRQPWRILEIDEYRDHPWPLSYEQAWREHLELWRHSEDLRRMNGRLNAQPPERADFYKRPVVLVLRNENYPRSAPKHWCAPISHGWQVLPEHYAVCRTCGELPPCGNGEYRGEIGPRAAAQKEGAGLCVPAGCCIGCAEPIKPRMRTVRFPGPNLWYPDLGEGSAIFHARTACADQVECYRLQWKAEHVPTAPQPTAPLWSPGTAENVLPPQTRLSPDASRSAGGWNAPAAGGSGAGAGTGAAEAAPAVPAAPAPPSAPQVDPQDEAAPPPAPERAQPQPARSARAPQPSRPAEPAPAPAPEPVPLVPATPASPAAPAPATPSAPPSASEAPAVPPAEELDAMRRLTEDLSSSLSGAADRPAFHDAEQAARVIEELTAAVRNIALCLNGTNLRTRP
ncbi:hypothetical protein ACG5V6_26100 [Streptomyces chitinivorans]|uniref:Uncharacterized protein n=1 Tax=Streptomyces chitinivorans TaxID=1257027 RepID=A0ABW7I0I0_9ACTN|nr:hypothetical protein [Streptomyces chitinivorans]MDH2410680.1 hypothetical protein [Streptomyces chitinivorans]